MSYVYIKSERAGHQGAEHDLFTVGFYHPDGQWEPESDYAVESEAADRVIVLNGGTIARSENAKLCTFCGGPLNEPSRAPGYKANNMEIGCRDDHVRADKNQTCRSCKGCGVMGVWQGRGEDGEIVDAPCDTCNGTGAVPSRGTNTREEGLAQRAAVAVEFWQKWAIGPKARPSCLVCGRADYDWPPGIQHAELPGIVVCHPCRDARSSTAGATEQEPVAWRWKWSWMTPSEGWVYAGKPTTDEAARDIEPLYPLPWAGAISATAQPSDTVAIPRSILHRWQRIAEIHSLDNFESEIRAQVFQADLPPVPDSRATTGDSNG